MSTALALKRMSQACGIRLLRSAHTAFGQLIFFAIGFMTGTDCVLHHPGVNWSADIAVILQWMMFLSIFLLIIIGGIWLVMHASLPERK
jgi:hypothetical protein